MEHKIGGKDIFFFSTTKVQKVRAPTQALVQGHLRLGQLQHAKDTGTARADLCCHPVAAKGRRLAKGGRITRP